MTGSPGANVDLQKAEAIVTYDENRATKEKLTAAVVDAGYKTA